MLSDGSGSKQVPRLDETKGILDRCGCVAGAVFGAYTDKAFYDLILTNDATALQQLAEKLLACFLGSGAEIVAGDALEGYSPTHDLCRGLLDAVTFRAGILGAAPTQNLAFPLVGNPGQPPPGLTERAVELDLNEAELADKLRAANGYPELAAEVKKAVAADGVDAFRKEVLWRHPLWHGFDGLPEEPPYYEAYGEKQVVAGIYDCVLRYREHLHPLLQSLRQWAARGSGGP